MTFICKATSMLVAALVLPAQAQVGDWGSYGHDEGGGRYSPLTDITPANVSTLDVAWTYHMNAVPARTGALPYSTTTPIVVDGMMYVGTPYGRVVALDPTNGREMWAYKLPDGDQPAFRGLAYWPGDKGHKPRLVFGTLRGRIIAIDAATGTPAAGFGDAGVVDSKTPDVLNGAPAGAFYSYSSPPAIFGNLAIFGSRLQERPALGPSGDVRAWDIVTGKPVWTFHAIPRAGERFADTWEAGSGKGRSGVNVWNLLTVDRERGTAYLAFSAPTYDRYGGDRKGTNLFANSVVAVDARTGQYRWHFQTIHHDIWDFDLHTAPVLVTVKRGGREIPGLAVMNKTALLFLLDRTTGKPIYGVTERPVPPSSVASEAAWPTQPFPNKPGILTRMSFDMSELDDTTPEHRAICQALVEKGGWVGSKMFEPIRADRPMIRFPGAAGGPEWGGGTFDPARGLFIFANNALGYVEKLVQEPSGWGASSVRFIDPKTRTPCQKGPWGELVAVDVNTGDVAWRSVLGVTDHFPADRQRTGRPSNAGPITTAGGVTFVGGTDDQRFRAFETATGKELWTYRLSYSAHATPISFRARDGRQYVAVVATGGSYLGSPAGGDSLIAFALPR